jgi:ankyrin repeat protein
MPAMLTNLTLWVYGIAAPLNPSMNKLHKYCVDHSEEVSRLVTHKSNSHVYIGVNDSDSLGLTPLMVAAIAKNIKAIEKLIKNGADIYRCPLTTKSKPVSEAV